MPIECDKNASMYRLKSHPCQIWINKEHSEYDMTVGGGKLVIYHFLNLWATRFLLLPRFDSHNHPLHSFSESTHRKTKYTLGHLTGDRAQ